jgi:hypothetical protein
MFVQSSSSTSSYLVVSVNLYIRNRPNAPEDTDYTRDKRRAREFDGLDKASIDMTQHAAIKKVVTETTKYISRKERSLA